MMFLQIRKWVELAQKSKYSASNLAQLCKVSSRQLQREFRRQIGCPPQAWLDELRIKEAQQLLLAGAPVKNVAIELGFKQTSHFCRKFKVQYSLTPTQFILQQFSSRK